MRARACLRGDPERAREGEAGRSCAGSHTSARLAGSRIEPDDRPGLPRSPPRPRRRSRQRDTGFAPTGTVARTWLELGIDPRHGAVERVRDPDGALRRRQARSARCRRRSSASPRSSPRRRERRWFSALSLIQTAPVADGNAAARQRRRRSSSTTRPDSGSMRETVRSSTFVTQTAPSPKATAVGLLPTRIGSPTTSLRVRVDARDGPGERVRNPDVARAEGDPARPVADADRVLEARASARRCGTRCSCPSSSPRSRPRSRRRA